MGGVCRTLPADDSAVAKADGFRHVASAGRGQFALSHRPGEDRWVDTVPFGCYRREVFDRIGLFDEELVRNQDDELNLRLIKHGGRILLSPRDRLQVFRPRFARQAVADVLSVRLFQAAGRAEGRRRDDAPPSWPRRCSCCALAVTAPGGAVSLAVLHSPWKLLAPLAFLLIAGSYLLAIGVCAAGAARKHGVAVAAALAIVFPTLHLSYGMGYLRGGVEFLLLRRGRRGDAGTVPITR